MANIFELTEDWKKLVEMADELDEQTLEDTLEALGEATADKVASMVAVVKSIKGELEVAKEYKKNLESRIKTMDNNVSRLNDYILLAVETIGKAKPGAEQFKKIEIKEKPWVKSVWTQYNPPSVQIVDERVLDAEYKIPQPDKVDTKAIAKKWKEKAEEYQEKRGAFMLELQQRIEAEEITEDDADMELYTFDKENKPEINGVAVEQTISVRYR